MRNRDVPRIVHMTNDWQIHLNENYMFKVYYMPAANQNLGLYASFDEALAITNEPYLTKLLEIYGATKYTPIKELMKCAKFLRVNPTRYNILMDTSIELELLRDNTRLELHKVFEIGVETDKEDVDALTNNIRRMAILKHRMWSYYLCMVANDWGKFNEYASMYTQNDRKG